MKAFLLLPLSVVVSVEQPLYLWRRILKPRSLLPAMGLGLMDATVASDDANFTHAVVEVTKF
jgi:hypothetical protein